MTIVSNVYAPRLDLSTSPLERVEYLLGLIVKDPEASSWDVAPLREVKIVSASEGRCEWEWIVKPAFCNKSGNLHGGCAATILDMATSMCLFTVAKPGFVDGGSVSRTLTCTFLAPVQAGSKVKVISEVVRGGKRLSHVRGEIVTEDGRVAVSCTHDKAELAGSKL